MRLSALFSNINMAFFHIRLVISYNVCVLFIAKYEFLILIDNKGPADDIKLASVWNLNQFR